MGIPHMVGNRNFIYPKIENLFNFFIGLSIDGDWFMECSIDGD